MKTTEFNQMNELTTATVARRLEQTLESIHRGGMTHKLDKMMKACCNVLDRRGEYDLVDAIFNKID